MATSVKPLNGHVVRSGRLDEKNLSGDSEFSVADVPAHHTKQTETKSADRRFWLTLFVFFSALDIVLFILLISVSVEVSRRRSEDTGGTTPSPKVLPEDSPFCLPCSEVYMTQLEVRQNRYKVTQRRDARNVTLLCCAESHDDLDTLIGRMYLRVRYPSDRAKGLVTVTNDTTNNREQLNGINPHLMLYQDTSKQPTEVNGTHSVPLKMPESGAEYNSTSVIFHNGSIKIVHAGLYYVYSHVPFKFAHPVGMSQYVYRVRNSNETLLLQNSVYPCDVSTESCLHSFVGGMFLFEEEDQIGLRVSDYMCIEQEKDTRFGVQRVI